MIADKMFLSLVIVIYLLCSLIDSSMPNHECMNKHPEHNDSIDEFLECADTLYSDKYNVHLLKEIQAYQENIEKRYEVKVPTTSKMMQILKKKHDKRVPSQYTRETCYDSFTPEFQSNIR
ncbi:hypothetical protein KSF78_0008993 [Schistosoma japonicum]|nr:hypothetical protein KSF78_0008993 [Schistosoma japonicum]